MANLFAWASISENGTVNGKAGDSTGNEVKTGSYYNFGQTHCIRIKDKAMRYAVATTATALANNEAIGYGQSDRHTLYNLCRNSGWSFDKVLKALQKTKVNTDCSSFVAVCVNLGFGKEIFPSDTYTGNIMDYAKKDSRFSVVKIATAEKKFWKSDMPVKAGKHIIINV